MTQYSVSVSATSNATINTQDTFIELIPPSGITILIKRIRVSNGHAGTDDHRARIIVRTHTSTPGTGTSQTPAKRRTVSPAAVTSANVKNGTTAFSVGTGGSIIMDISWWSRSIVEWVARDFSDYIAVANADKFSIIVQNNIASRVTNVDCDFIE